MKIDKRTAGAKELTQQRTHPARLGAVIPSRANRAIEIPKKRVGTCMSNPATNSMK